MIKKSKIGKSNSPEVASHEKDAKQLAEVKDANDVALVNRQLSSQIRGAVFYPQGATKKTVRELGDRAVALVTTSKPGDTQEAMLISHMVAAHNEIMRSHARGHDAVSGEFEDRMFNRAAKFSQVYVRQMEALDKHRGRGQQKVTVEHVYVAPGGQAIVGNVEVAATSQTENKPTNQTPLEIDHEPGVAFEMPQTEAAPIKIVKPGKTKDDS